MEIGIQRNDRTALLTGNLQNLGIVSMRFAKFRNVNRVVLKTPQQVGGRPGQPLVK